MADDIKSFRIPNGTGLNVIKSTQDHNKDLKNDNPNIYKGQISGTGSYFSEPGRTLEYVSNRTFLTDSPEALKTTTTTESVTGVAYSNDSLKVDRKKYLEEILGMNTTEAEKYFNERFKVDGVLRNFGKLMSDTFKDQISWSRAFDPRLPLINRPGARQRARVKFWGYYNTGIRWGDPLEYIENPWYKAVNDSVYVNETNSLWDINFRKYDNGGKGEPNYTNFYFNMGLGFGESQVFNPPFQYNDLDDPRTHPRYTKIGRVYASKVLANMPVMMMMPGRIKYNTNAFTTLGIDFGASKANVNYLRGDNILTETLSAAWIGLTDVLGTMASFATSVFTGGRLITFKQQINLFQKYFDEVATQLATNMGLITPTGKYTGRWQTLSLTHIQPGIGLQRSGYGSGFGKGWRGNQMIALMMDKSVSCSETFSNSTRENPLMTELNNAASQAAAENASGDNALSAKNMFKNLTNTVMTGDISHMGGALDLIKKNLLSNVSETATIESGQARMVFPEIWDSSSFSRSYSFSFDCYAPYGNALCKFETWGIQLALWLTASLPRQVGTYSYYEPFVHRFVFPGKFNINYGIITDFSVERGADLNDWNNTDNLPRTLKINISVKDYQPSITLPRASRSLLKRGYESLFPATGFAEYIGTVAGLSLADQVDWKRRFGRAFRTWTSSWRRRVNSDILLKSIFNISPVDFIGNIVKPYGDLFDSIDQQENEAMIKEFQKSGIKAVTQKLKTIKGTDSGAFFNYPLRQIYRTVYSSDNSLLSKMVSGGLRAVGKIIKPKDTKDGWKSNDS